MRTQTECKVLLQIILDQYGLAACISQRLLSSPAPIDYHAGMHLVKQIMPPLCHHISAHELKATKSGTTINQLIDPTLVVSGYMPLLRDQTVDCYSSRRQAIVAQQYSILDIAPGPQDACGQVYQHLLIQVVALSLTYVQVDIY